MGLIFISIITLIVFLVLGNVFEDLSSAHEITIGGIHILEFADDLSHIFCIIAGIVLFIALFIGTINNITGIGEKSRYEQEYEYLSYCCKQVDNGYGDKLNLNNATLIEKVGDYNKRVSSFKEYSANFLTKGLVPSFFENLELIDLNSIKFIDDNDLVIDMGKMSINFN